MKIGVDVGGTNTDALCWGQWRPWLAQDADHGGCLFSGIVAAITQAIADAAVDRADVDCVMIGTTQFTNAVIQRRPCCRLALSVWRCLRLGHSTADGLAQMT